MHSEFPVREVFARAGDAFIEDHFTSKVQRNAVSAIADCKSGRLGVNKSVCDECGHTELHNCSCRNRSCPNCQVVMKDIWVEQRRSEVIDAKYFHAVFTVPHSLNALFLSNQTLMYKLLFAAASQTLLTLSRDKRYLGAEPGIIMLPHTWSRTMDYHPHVHCIISGAGLTKDNKLYTTDWCPYIKDTLNGSGDALKYLGRYTNRVAISNARITDVTDSTVTFWYKDRKDHNIRKEMTLTHEEFIRRFLMHVLPKGFQKIRYYGYLSNPVKKKKLWIIFELQGRQLFKARFSVDTPKDIILKELYGIDVHKCPRCGKLSLRFGGMSSSRRE